MGIKDPDSIANLISYIRSEGFDSSLVASKNLPKYIHRRGTKFVVRYIKGDGRNGYKTMDSEEAAIAYQETAKAPAESDAGMAVEAEDEHSSAETLIMGEYGRIQAEDENDSEELAECERAADEIQAE